MIKEEAKAVDFYNGTMAETAAMAVRLDYPGESTNPLSDAAFTVRAESSATISGGVVIEWKP